MLSSVDSIIYRVVFCAMNLLAFDRLDARSQALAESAKGEEPRATVRQANRQDDELSPNPSLTKSHWAMAHANSGLQASTSLPGIAGRRPAGDPPRVDVQVVRLGGWVVIVAFDDAGEVYTVSKGLTKATLWKLDGKTLEPRASTLLPSHGLFSGIYFLIDNRNRVVVGSGTKIVRFVESAGSFSIDASLDVAHVEGGVDELVAASLLYTGECAFISKNGVIGVADPNLARVVASMRLKDEKVSNSFAIDESNSMYLVTTKAAYGIGWDAKALRQHWRHPVTTVGHIRPGKFGVGSGTSPALLGSDYVVLADDERSMNVLVLRRGSNVRDEDREAAKVHPFSGLATTENKIAVAGRKMVVDQNLVGRTGVACLELLDDETCKVRWVSNVHAPSCVPTISTASKMVYVYTRKNLLWVLTGLDLETGATVLEVEAGRGPLFNNLYSAVAIGPERSIFVGLTDGLVRFRERAGGE